MSDYDRLIDDYRVSLPTKNWLGEWVPYGLGFFLLIAPFIRELVLPMAIFSLLYFFFVFLSLLAIDVGRVIFVRSQMFIRAQIFETFERLVISFTAQLLAFQALLSESFRRNSLALQRALARWETRVFSKGLAWANVFLSSFE